jgi:hypothetical protein
MADETRPKSIEELLEEFNDPPYTREQFEADFARVVARISAKHGITEPEVDALIREHRYTHSAEDIEDEYIQLMAIAAHTGWRT